MLKLGSVKNKIIKKTFIKRLYNRNIHHFYVPNFSVTLLGSTAEETILLSKLTHLSLTFGSKWVYKSIVIVIDECFFNGYL